MILFICIFFFKQKTAYEMRISDWSSDVCSSDLTSRKCANISPSAFRKAGQNSWLKLVIAKRGTPASSSSATSSAIPSIRPLMLSLKRGPHNPIRSARSEEHTSELQSLMRISYAVFCLNNKTNQTTQLFNQITTDQYQRQYRHKKTKIINTKKISKHKE